MEINNITKYLSGKNKKVFTQMKNFEIIKKTLEKNTSFIDIKNISIKNTILTIKLSTTKKQELSLKKEKLIKEMNDLAGEKIVSEIK